MMALLGSTRQPVGSLVKLDNFHTDHSLILKTLSISSDVFTTNRLNLVAAGNFFEIENGRLTGNK